MRSLARTNDRITCLLYAACRDRWRGDGQYASPKTGRRPIHCTASPAPSSGMTTALRYLFFFLTSHSGTSGQVIDTCPILSR